MQDSPGRRTGAPPSTLHHGWLTEEFEPDGIAVSSLRASPDRTFRESHIDHRVETSFRHGGNAPPLWSRSQELLDANVVVDIGHHPDRRLAVNNGTPNVFTVSGKLARTRPDIVARYMLQVLRASEWARRHPREASSIIAKEVGTMDDWMPEAFDSSMYEDLAPSLRPELVDA